MKKLGLIVLTLLLCSMFVFAASAEMDIKVLLNGTEIISPDKPIEIGGRTLLPVRIIAEAMGCTVTWYDETQVVNLKSATTIVAMQINNNQVTVLKNVDDKERTFTIDIPPMLINNRTYIPVRAFAEALEANVGWDDSTHTVLITYDVGLKYHDFYVVETFAGTGKRTRKNGKLDETSFANPEGIAMSANGEMCIADNGAIRIISDGKSDTLVFEQAYATAKKVAYHGDTIYALTQDYDGYRAIITVKNGRAYLVYKRMLVDGHIVDFDIAPDGMMYLLVNDYNFGTTKLVQVNLNANYSYVDMKDFEGTMRAFTIGDNGFIYLANPSKNSIYSYNVNTGAFKLFAGATSTPGYVDGPSPTFTEPKELDYDSNYLYVLDGNVIRRVSVNAEGKAIAAETLAGKLDPNATKFPVTSGKGAEVLFCPFNDSMSILAKNDVVYLTDTENAVVRKIYPKWS